MRYLVLSDIHANLEALETVIEAAAEIPHDRVLVLGDLVGYGADPNAVVERIRELRPFAVIRGNHDKVGAGLEPSDAFNAVARTAIRWTYEALSDDNRDWLAELPAGPVAIDELLEICHGTPFDEDAYVFDEADVLRSMQASSRRLCLFGHTHVQVGYRLVQASLTLETADQRRPLHVAHRRRPLPDQPGVGGTAARRRSAGRLRRLRRRGQGDRDLPHGLPGRAHPGAHPRGRAARGAGAATDDRQVAERGPGLAARGIRNRCRRRGPGRASSASR